jgi:hypothetical protein
MKRALIILLILFFLQLGLNADILDIPEIKVYGERKIEVKTVNKELLPFEKEYLEPSVNKKKNDLPVFEIIGKKQIGGNIGLRVRGNAGTDLGGYLLGYMREYFYPLEGGLEFVANSYAEDSVGQIFSRTSVENFYLHSAAYCKKTVKPLYRFSLGNTHNIIDFDFIGVYSDSLIGVADITLNYFLFELNLQLETSLDYSVKASYKEYPLEAGVVWFDKKIYPELVFFLPFYDLYLKSCLLNKIGIAYLYCQSPQYLNEYASLDTYYRVEFGQTREILPLSLIYSHYLKNSLNYLGIRGTHREIFFEFEYPLESDYDYIFRAGISTKISELINTSIFGNINGSENYFIGADFGYDLLENLRVGIEGNYIYGWENEDGFDISGYVFFAF